MINMQKWTMVLAVSLMLCTNRANAQQTIRAASCSQSDVQAALNSVKADGTTVIIPACPSGIGWSSGASYQQVYSTTIQGQSSVTAVDSLGNPTGYNDQTVLVNNVTSGKSMLNINTATGKLLTIYGISFKGGTGLTTSGQLNVSGKSQSNSVTSPQLRIYNNHFYSQPSGEVTCLIGGWIYGVVDHNLFDLGQGQVTNGCRVSFSTAFGDNLGNGNGSWAQPTDWGQQDWVFFENNTYNYAFASDCDHGGKQVYRFNVFNYSNEQSHESGMRGCRATEDYKNIVVGGSGIATNNSHDYLRMGGLISWGNTPTGIGNFIEFHMDRSECNSLSQHGQQQPPFGPGYTWGSATANPCWGGMVTTSGTAVTYANGTNFAGPNNQGCNASGPKCVSNNTIIYINGTRYKVSTWNSDTSLTLQAAVSPACVAACPFYFLSDWDGNTDSSGYPARDQPGRGQGDLISGSEPNACDTVDYGGGSDCTNGIYTGRWPNQALDPVYAWLNGNGSGFGSYEATGTASNGALFQNQRDFYLETYSTSVTGGVGVGTLAQRPATCNAAPGGGGPGEAYWATDVANPKNPSGPLSQGALYVCNPANTWNLWYQPYTYPHPLVTGSSAGNVAPPAGLTATVLAQ